MSSVLNPVESWGCPRILVVGDLILDRYTFGNAERVSPEAPVVVLQVDSKEVRLGGAASVAMLLRGLGAEVILAGVVGDDSEGRTLHALLRDDQIDGELVLVDASRPTTVKERIIGRAANRHAHQIVRVDHEARAPLSSALEESLFAGLARQPWGRFSTGRRQQQTDGHDSPCGAGVSSADPASELRTPHCEFRTSFDAVLISDYAKGVCTPALLRRVIDLAREFSIPVIIDPARIADYSRYAGATLIKPNRTEAELATGTAIGTLAEAIAAAEQLRRHHEFESVLITLDRDGMALVADPRVAGTPDVPSSGEKSERSNSSHATHPATYVGGSPESTLMTLHLPTTPREVYDVTGAGDMVLAALGLCLAAQIPLPQAAHVANIAAGLQVERSGVARITRQELAHALFDSSNISSRSAASAKLVSLPAAVALAATYRAHGKSLVFTNGCFDLLHVGHVTMLEQAAALGDVLIVAVNSDAGVRRLKGAGRPVMPEQHRAALLAAIGCVDHVVIYDDPTPHALLKKLRPDMLVKGGTTTEIIGHEVVESYGGRALRLSELPGVSTTSLIAAAAS